MLDTVLLVVAIVLLIVLLAVNLARTNGLRGIEAQRDEGQRQLLLKVAEMTAVMSAQSAQADRLREQLDARLLSNEGRINDMRDRVFMQLQALQRDNTEKLTEIRQMVDQRLQEALDKRLSESFNSVSERLAQVYKGLGEMQQLAQGVGDLKRVMTGVKTRGIWGEVQLTALLADLLSQEQYELNVAVRPGAAERVEAAVRLPGQGDEPIFLPIDAKFPLEDYQRLLDAQEAGEREQVEAAGRQLELAIKREAKRISEKYIAPPHTTDIAFLYLPTEGLYAEALRRPGLQSALQQSHRVIIAGPSTLSAMLNALQMGFRTLAIQKRSGEVWSLLGAVKAEFGKFGLVLDKVYKQLQTAGNSIEEATRKTRTIERKLRGVEELPAAEAAGLLPDDPAFEEE